MDSLLHQALKDYVYDIVGYVMNECKQLPCGLPEYIYQETFVMELKAHGIGPNKENQTLVATLPVWVKTQVSLFYLIKKYNNYDTY